MTDDQSQRIRQGLRRAVQQGAVLGGLRPATERSNTAAHEEALRQAMDYRDVLEAGCDKSLSALSRDLFEAGCCTRSGKPLTTEMVRRLRNRLEKAKQAPLHSHTTSSMTTPLFTALARNAIVRAQLIGAEVAALERLEMQHLSDMDYKAAANTYIKMRDTRIWYWRELATAAHLLGSPWRDAERLGGR
jgi:hypothetical protein